MVAEELDFVAITRRLRDRCPSTLLTIDSHTAGEPTRLIVGGVPPLPGATMMDKRRYFLEHLDHVRLLVTREPRGHRNLLAALVTEGVTEGADFGLIYMDACRCPYLCGHATIGAVTTLVAAGVVPARASETPVVVDTPSGPMETTAYARDGKVQRVAFESVPAFVHQTGCALELPSLGTIEVDTVCVGGFFAMVSADQVPFAFSAVNGPRFVELGMEIIRRANEQLEVRHPTNPEVNTVDVVEFYDPSDESWGRGRNVVVYGESHMDRSPCGTGTTAKIALLHHHRQLGVDQPFRNESFLGATFEGRIKRETTVGSKSAVVVEISGSAHIMGFCELVFEPEDPFPRGFLL